MKKFVASTPDAEIIGQALLAVQDSVLFGEYADLVEKHGLKSINAQAWYKQDQILGLHRDILDTPNSGEKLISIGTKIAENFPFEDHFTIEQALELLQELHLQVHRHIAQEDCFTVKKVGNNHFEITNGSPFPDQLVYGYVYSIMKRFHPANAKPILRYRDHSRENYDENMIFDLMW